MFWEYLYIFMDFSIEKLPKSQLEIKIQISAPEFQGFIDKAIFQLGQNLKVKGFRKGKVPKEIIEKEIGQDKILKEAAQLAIRENYLRVISKNKITAVANPKTEILSSLQADKELLFKVKISVLPEIILPDYKKIAVSCKKKKVLVEEKEIKEALSFLQRSRAKFSQIARPAQKGDFVEIEFSSPNIEGGAKQKDAFLLGQGRLIPGFEEKLEGMEASEKKTFSLQFPKEHFQPPTTFMEGGATQTNDTKSGGGLAGKEVNLEVKMISVQKMEPPEINDQFARSLGQFENVAALKQNIIRGLNLEKEGLEKQRIHREILKKIIEKISWEIPQVLIIAEENRMLENFKKEIADKFQISFEDYLKKVNQTEEAVKQPLRQEAETRIKGFLVLNKIATTENIEITEEEIKNRIDKVLSNYQDIKEAKKQLDLEKLKLYIEGEIRNEKTFEKLESFSEND
ncbi:hypothetical protein LCGC14_0214190 [marine sediment metagenome]|uniref:peptidylprolyl isomerase n=1 Tax=marine sediment metagenome TaxID=412755 RepID=A0A0F9WZ40_9ZZZZ